MCCRYFIQNAAAGFGRVFHSFNCALFFKNVKTVGALAGCVGTLERIDHRRGWLFVSVCVMGQSVFRELDNEDVAEFIA